MYHKERLPVPDFPEYKTKSEPGFTAKVNTYFPNGTSFLTQSGSIFIPEKDYKVAMEVIQKIKMPGIIPGTFWDEFPKKLQKFHEENQKNYSQVQTMNDLMFLPWNTYLSVLRFYTEWQVHDLLLDFKKIKPEHFNLVVGMVLYKVYVEHQVPWG